MTRRYVVRNLGSRRDVDNFVETVNAVGPREPISLVMAPTTVYPNAAVPFAAALGHYRSKGRVIRIAEENDQSRKFRVVHPQKVTQAAVSDLCLSKVWQYHSEIEAMQLCSAFVQALSEHAECSSGVIESLNWCLYEVMDNVFQHSIESGVPGSAVGYAMMQVHRRTRMVSVGIADAGIGVHRSFLLGGVHPAADAYEALKLAVQERVTSKTKNMGNGLFGLLRVVGLNDGKLEIYSGRGRLSFTGQRLEGEASFSRPLLELNDHHATSVDWQLDLARPVHLEDALSIPSRSNLRLEELENDEGQHEIRVADLEEGLGTRKSAESVRIRLENLLHEGVPRLLLNFDQVGIISSSFADEVLGKLALRMGLMAFMRRFEFGNMTPTVSAIVDRAIQQRIEEGDDSSPGSASKSWRPQS